MIEQQDNIPWVDPNDVNSILTSQDSILEGLTEHFAIYRIQRNNIVYGKVPYIPKNECDISPNAGESLHIISDNDSNSHFKKRIELSCTSSDEESAPDANLELEYVSISYTGIRDLFTFTVMVFPGYPTTFTLKLGTLFFDYSLEGQYELDGQKELESYRESKQFNLESGSHSIIQFLRGEEGEPYCAIKYMKANHGKTILVYIDFEGNKHRIIVDNEQLSFSPALVTSILNGSTTPFLGIDIQSSPE